MKSLRPGDPLEIGGYRLLARLGAGGMGEVFLARTTSGRALALKTVHRELSMDADFAHRFDREIRTSDRVRSPWTVSVVDFSAPGASPQWLATEYVPAPSLGDWVSTRGPLETPAVRRLGQQLAAALVSVRAAGVVHRDIKPANVLLGAERPFLIDFGIARTVRDPRHTRTGTVIGTPGFLAPEQATGTVAGAPADVFSLAAVLVYAATGRSPFLADGEELDLPALLYRIVHDEPRLDGLPQPLHALVRQCLAKDPQQRPLPEDVAARLTDDPPEQGWGPATPQALTAETRRRETELHQLLTHPQPGTATGTGTGTDTGTPATSGTPGADGTPPVPVPVPAYPPASGPAAVPVPLSPPPPPAASPLPGGLTGDGTAPNSPAPPGRGPGRAVLRSRGAATAAGAAAVAAAAVALAVWLPGHGNDGEGDGHGAPSPTPSAGPAGTLPAAWTGTWTGVGPGTPEADGITRARTGEFSVTVTFNGGAVGELVGRQVSDLKESSTGRNLGCTEALRLQQIRQNGAVFEAVTSHPTDRTAVFECPRGNLYVLTMTDPNRLTLETEGAQSAGAPTALTRHP
ncbi:serine/threonine-protein kinase [Streptomyces xanthophaeus]|uniref:serine/threonine-protein kinase n=1 Tax=Streptomyces xanthophaeus TaxID=67385 RepID=UPI00264873F2|nr:serine/threonine-protein kinase [Streptomyces xanthophaeus]WKD30558.1 serine/threonine protein kinase [Streptomyces xanthophaeus]